MYGRGGTQQSPAPTADNFYLRWNAAGGSNLSRGFERMSSASCLVQLTCRSATDQRHHPEAGEYSEAGEY
jgi:hypothetical protein